jgi:hypothetical protein
MPQIHDALFLLLEQRVRHPGGSSALSGHKMVISSSGACGHLSMTNTGKWFATASAATLATATSPTFVCKS